MTDNQLRIRIAKIVEAAAIDKLTGPQSRDITKAISDAALDHVKSVWKESKHPISKRNDFPTAIEKFIVPKVMDALEKKEIALTEEEIKAVKEVTAETLETISEAGEFKMIASEELIFASEDEALQHLADLTGKQIKIAN